MSQKKNSKLGLKVLNNGVFTMKRLFELVLCSALILCLSGCSSAVPSAEISESTTSVQITVTSESEAEFETSATADTAVTTETTTGNDTIVIYFSATGTTKGIAENIAVITGADLYEITAAVPYTDEDRDWTDSDSRCSIEQNDPAVRPAVGSEPVSLDGYSVIFIGYPIWFGQEPRIMDTFVESCDFGNAKVIPFCTSGSSGIGQSGHNLTVNAGSGNWIEGKRFAGDASEEEIKEWVNSVVREMVLKINGTEVPVIWEDNDSVKELAGIAEGGLTIEMSMYGGFEQVGPIGQSITSNDEQITTSPGDIVLYSGDQVVIFYGSNTWSYTKLGVIDLPEQEIADLLSNGEVTINIAIR